LRIDGLEVGTAEALEILAGEPPNLHPSFEKSVAV
jgi:hypothetical protein